MCGRTPSARAQSRFRASIRVRPERLVFFHHGGAPPAAGLPHRDLFFCPVKRDGRSSKTPHTFLLQCVCMPRPSALAAGRKVLKRIGIECSGEKIMYRIPCLSLHSRAIGLSELWRFKQICLDSLFLTLVKKTKTKKKTEYQREKNASITDRCMPPRNFRIVKIEKQEVYAA